MGDENVLWKACGKTAGRIGRGGISSGITYGLSCSPYVIVVAGNNERDRCR